MAAYLHAVWRDTADLRRDQLLALSAAYATGGGDGGMNLKTRKLAELDRVIHEPGRLMLVALLSAVEQADFLYLQHETEMNKGTLSSHLSKLEEAGYVE